MGKKLKKVSKGSRQPVASGDGRTPVEIEVSRRAPRVGALAWRHDRGAYACTTSQVVSTLETLQKSRKLDADLILCSGIRVRPDGGTPADRSTPPAELAEKIVRAAGCPVLMEMRPSGRNDRHRWMLATRGGFEEIRRDQYVARSAPSKQAVQQVLTELRSGYGQLSLRGPSRAVNLVLVICGEARIFAAGRRGSRLLYGWSDKELPQVFTGRWVMLHPSHDRYESTSKHCGFGIVGPWTLKHGLRRRSLLATITGGARSDGASTMPATAIHAGPWAHNDRETPYGVRSYAGGREGEAGALYELGDGAVLYEEFEV